MILIISDKIDLQIYWVTYYLSKWNIKYSLFSVAEYPQNLLLTSTWTNGVHRESFVLPENGQLVDCDNIKAVWYRKPDLPRLPSNLEKSTKEYAYNECRQGLSGFYNSLSDCFWISPIQNIMRAGNKPFQLSTAAKLDFSIPDTIVTNDPERAYQFYKNHNSSVVYKTLSDGLFSSREGPWENARVNGYIYTTPLSPQGKEDFKDVTNCPCLFQEYVPKKFELRITIVGNKVFAAEIYSQDNPASRHDWRQGDINKVQHKIHELPTEISQKCLLLVETLGLKFGAVDMIYTPDNRYVFLEINPNGQYGWVENATGLNISETIAQTLVDRINHL
jgi:hypothetical protein